MFRLSKILVYSAIHIIFYNADIFACELLVNYGWHLMNFEPTYAHKTTVLNKV